MTLGLRSGEVRLLEAHAEWASMFEHERRAIAEAVGDALTIQIEHVGSTAIPGVPAKPILDIAIGVRDYEAARVSVAPMERLGYEYRGEHGIAERLYFVKGDPRTHHVHMVERDSEKWTSMVGFRDALRANPRLAREYAQQKAILAAQFAANREAYQAAKDLIVERLLRAVSR
ncbi:MAG: GrpB family protein [Acidobacteriota bacterium]